MAIDSTESILPVAGNYAINVSIPDLKMVEIVLQYRFITDPIVSHGTVENELIIGNTIGFTLVGVGGGTTLTTTVVAIGQ